MVKVSEKLVASRVRTDSPEGESDSDDSEVAEAKMIRKKKKKKMQLQMETLEAIAKGSIDRYEVNEVCKSINTEKLLGLWALLLRKWIDV